MKITGSAVLGGTLFLLLASFFGSAAADNDIEELEIASYVLPGKELTIGAKVYFPKAAEGKLPVYFYVTGIGGFVPEGFYASFFRLLAHENIIVVALSRLQFPSYPRLIKQVDTAMHWVEENLSLTIAQKGFPNIVPDIDEQLILGCQSAGCRGILQYLNNTCGLVKGVVWDSPVDAFPLLTDPENKMPFKTPSLILAAGLDYKSLNFIFPSCVP